MSSDDNGTDDVKCAPLHRLCAPLPREPNGAAMVCTFHARRAMCRSGIVGCSADDARIPKRAVGGVETNERREGTTGTGQCNGYRMARGGMGCADTIEVEASVLSTTASVLPHGFAIPQRLLQ